MKKLLGVLAVLFAAALIIGSAVTAGVVAGQVKCYYHDGVEQKTIIKEGLSPKMCIAKHLFYEEKIGEFLNKKDAVIKAQKDLIASQQEMIGLQEGKNDFANRLRDENQRLIKAQQELLDQRTFGDTP